MFSGGIGAAFGQCKDFAKKTDKFDGSVTVRSPLTKGPYFEPVVITRRTSEGRTFFFLRLSVRASLSAPRTGVYLLLANGQKMEWPDERVEVKYLQGYHADGSVSLTPEQLETLSKVAITDIRLHIFDMELSKKEGERFQERIACAVTLNADDVKEK